MSRTKRPWEVGLDRFRALLPGGVLLIGAAIHGARPLASVVLALGFAATLRWGSGTDRWAWGATLPVAANLTFGLIPTPAAAPDLGDCANALSPPAVWRALHATVVFAVVIPLARLLGADAGSLRLRLPSRPLTMMSITLMAVCLPLGLLVGPRLAEPFFGQIHLELSLPGAVVPAVVLALANGSMEEVAYRGALLGWGTRAWGVRTGLAIQALAFGFAHTGTDVGGIPILVVAGLSTSGFLAGLVVLRTRSLLLPLLVHAALDVPLYYHAACSIG